METSKITVQVKDTICEKLTNKETALEMSQTLTDLGLDDLDKIEIIMKLEEAFMIEISDNDADQLHSINDVVSYIEQSTQK